MTSFDTMCLVGDIKTVFDVELKAIDFLNNKTVGEMAAYIESVCEKN
jgi:acyl carrier protein